MNLLKNYLSNLHAQNKNRICELYLDVLSDKLLEYEFLGLRFCFLGHLIEILKNLF